MHRRNCLCHLKTLLERLVAVVLFACIAGVGAARAQEAPRSVAWYPAAGDSLLDRFAPVFVTEQAEHAWNRIGTPAARLDQGGEEEIFVDPDEPAVYRRRIAFEAGGRNYTNLIYRVHFERSPFTWAPLNVGTGRNVGLIVVITLDSWDRPVWITTVQTCGCYHAVVPTDYLPRESWPRDWDPSGLTVYGEQLPGLLHWSEAEPQTRLVAFVRGGTHRVMDLALMSEAAVAASHEVRSASSRPIADLDRLPLPGGTTSFFHESGRRRGLVKGAWKPLETLLFGLWIQDFHVGRDRRYGPRDETRLFYTTLNPIKKSRSDMWRFASFLEFDGWKAGAAPRGVETVR